MDTPTLPLSFEYPSTRESALLETGMFMPPSVASAKMRSPPKALSRSSIAIFSARSATYKSTSGESSTSPSSSDNETARARGQGRQAVNDRIRRKINNFLM